MDLYRDEYKNLSINDILFTVVSVSSVQNLSMLDERFFIYSPLLFSYNMNRIVTKSKKRNHMIFNRCLYFIPPDLKCLKHNIYFYSKAIAVK